MALAREARASKGQPASGPVCPGLLIRGNRA